MNTPIRPWRKNYRAVFGALGEGQANEWEDYIKAAIQPPPVMEEFNQAVAQLCDGNKVKPDAKAIAERIMQDRATNNGDTDTARTRALTSARRSIKYARTAADAWRAACGTGLDTLTRDGMHWERTPDGGEVQRPGMYWNISIEDRETLVLFAEQTRPDLCDQYGRLKDRAEGTVSLGEIIHGELNRKPERKVA